MCNLGSINLAHHVELFAEGPVHGEAGRFDFDKLAETVRLAVRQLDRVIDLNFYPIETARRANLRWRPVGLGAMGLQDVFFKLRLPFDSAAGARAVAARSPRASTSTRCRRRTSWRSSTAATRASTTPAPPHGELQFEAWGVTPSEPERWDGLRARIAEHGLRNSLLIAIAPTATIASIAGCYECIEPQVSNLFKRETLSGDFLVVNRYLADELKQLGLWTAELRDRIKMAEGSIQGITEIPESLRAGLPHRLGGADALADRHGGRARRVHRPEPVAQPVHREPEHRPARRRCTCTRGSAA